MLNLAFITKTFSMTKLIIPILLGVFMMSFSGKPVTKFTCGPTIDIEGPNSGHILKVEVRNNAAITTTYNNPVFPITHVDTGNQIEVRFYLDASYHFAVYQENYYGYDCNSNNYHTASQGSVTFATECSHYRVMMIETSAGDDFLCP